MLQFILGRAGSGKTEYVFKSISQRIQNGENNILLITPEQYSFVAEKRLLSELGEMNSGLVESSSFSRLTEEVFNIYGGVTLPILTKGSKAVMMKKAIESVQDGLCVFKRSIASSAFIKSSVSIYDEMKSCRVSVDALLNASENSERELLGKKLKDISLIIGAYDALISDAYEDSANLLTRLYEVLRQKDYFRHRTVFIDGFSGFVAQEYKIIEVILEQADEVYVTFCSDSYLNTDKYDLFSYVNSNIRILKEVAQKAGVKIPAPIELKDNLRTESTELRYAEKYAFSPIKKQYNESIEDINVYCAKNICDECDNVALNISRLLRKGYKANEISVITRDLDKYERELGFSLEKFNIPYFKDERQSVKSQPLIMLAGFLLRTVIYSFRSEDIFSLLKTGLTELDDEKINALENYVYLWNINGSRWKKDFTESTKGFSDTISESEQKRIDEINEIRKYVVDKLLKFRSACKGSTALDICKAIYWTIIDFSADKQLKLLAQELDLNGKSALAEEQGRIWDLLMEILDNLANIGGKEKISVSDFYKLFELMVDCEDLGALPMGLDNVQLGSADRIRCDNPRAVFIVGANEGEFPKSVTASGLLSDIDRSDLIKNDFKLYSYGEALNAQESYFAYMALSSPREKLFVSYLSYGEENSESSIVRGLKAVFPALKVNTYNSQLSLYRIESRDNAFELLASNYGLNDAFISSLNEYFENEKNYVSRLNAVKRIYQNNEIRLNNKSVATDLFGKNMYLSASRIEDFYNCAFRYFCKFGLNARPRKRAEMDPMQTGTVIHYVLEQIIKENKNLSSMTDEEITLDVNLHLRNYLESMMGDSEDFTPRFKYQFMRLSRMLISVVKRLRAEFEQSDFTAAAFELRIGDGTNGESVKSRKFNLQDGGSIEIKGAIDRVDTYTENGVRYVRVVDYKSGNKKFRLSDIIYGLNLQMFIYLFTLCKSDGEFSGTESGVLYMHSARNMFSFDRNADTEKLIASEENKLYKMKGIVVNDEEHPLAQHMEHSLSGKYIPVKYEKKSGTITGDAVTLEELGMLSRRIDALVSEMGIKLHSGEISQNPVNGKDHDKTCDFCDYRDVCMNRRELPTREIKELTNEQVINIVREEDNA